MTDSGSLFRTILITSSLVITDFCAGLGAGLCVVCAISVQQSSKAKTRTTGPKRFLVVEFTTHLLPLDIGCQQADLWFLQARKAFAFLAFTSIPVLDVFVARDGYGFKETLNCF